MVNDNMPPEQARAPSDTAEHSDAHPDQQPDESPDNAPPDDTAALDAAAATWQRKGYRIRYRDPFLIQLIRRDRLGWRSAPFLALALATMIACVAALVVALQRRPWHVVTLVTGPDRRVLTHHLHAPHPPAP